jgi:predicted DCC family thiol-disulfide oxidoreductase YuxK
MLESRVTAMAHPILLYDGICGLCNRVNQFVLRHDRNGIFRFSALQSPLAARILARHGESPQVLDTFYLVMDYEVPGERLTARSDATVLVLKMLGGPWRMAGILLECLPRCLRDWAYRLIARSRYRLFGRFDTCMLPCAEHRERFLDA